MCSKAVQEGRKAGQNTSFYLEIFCQLQQENNTWKQQLNGTQIKHGGFLNLFFVSEVLNSKPPQSHTVSCITCFMGSPWSVTYQTKEAVSQSTCFPQPLDNSPSRGCRASDLNTSSLTTNPLLWFLMQSSTDTQCFNLLTHCHCRHNFSIFHIF